MIRFIITSALFTLVADYFQGENGHYISHKRCPFALCLDIWMKYCWIQSRTMMDSHIIHWTYLLIFVLASHNFITLIKTKWTRKECPNVMKLYLY